MAEMKCYELTAVPIPCPTALLRAGGGRKAGNEEKGMGGKGFWFCSLFLTTLLCY